MTRRALVTGGTGQLGRAVVGRLLDDGIEVHATWIAEPEVSDFRATFERQSQTGLHRVDVTSPADMTQLVDALGGVDILVNTVGGYSGGPIDSTGLADWEKMLRLNTTSAFVSTQAAVAGMKARGFGRVINISAAAAIGGAANMAAYAASKGAVLTLTESLARELMKYGITVNALLPTTIDTPANRRSMPEADTSHWLRPAEIAAVISFLASEAGAIVTGTAVRLGR